MTAYRTDDEQRAALSLIQPLVPSAVLTVADEPMHQPQPDGSCKHTSVPVLRLGEREVSAIVSDGYDGFIGDDLFDSAMTVEDAAGFLRGNRVAAVELGVAMIPQAKRVIQ